MFHIYEGFHLVETYHKMRHQRKYHPEDSSKRVIKIALVAIVTLLLWNMPTEWYGIQNLTVIQQRIIAIFAFATLMWILEIVSSWATSIAIMVLMLLFCTDSGIAPMVNEEEVGALLSFLFEALLESVSNSRTIPNIRCIRSEKDWISF